MEDDIENKDFNQHFFMLFNKLQLRENFAFSRFSDGELRIMENKELVLGENFNKIGGRVRRSHYEPEDRKHFDPEKHQHVREALFDAYRYKADNYYVGLSCRCCVGEVGFRKMVEWRGGNDKYLTWSNLWVNNNYPLFVEHMIPEFKNHNIVFILNEKASLDGLPFPVMKDFRVGDNCIVNDFDKWKEVSDWMWADGINDCVFLFSASSLSNIMIHELYKLNPNNTYIDIGTTLNPYLGLKSTRGYLTGKNRKQCIW